MHVGTYERTPEIRAKISAGLRGNQNALGHKPTEEARAKIGAAGRGLNSYQHPYNTGRLLSLHSGGYALAYFLGHWVRSHRLCYVYYTGIHSIPSNWHVHHINEDRLDNRRENLELLTKSEHKHRHSL